MRYKNIVLFLVVCFLCGVGAFAGSVLGRDLAADGLFLGAIAGGILGILAAVWVAAHLKMIEGANYFAVSICAIAGFLLASIITVTNLYTAIIPLASVALIGLGAVVGNKYVCRIRTPKYTAASAAIGLAVSAPALFFVSASLLKYGLGVGQPFDLLEGIFSNPTRMHSFNLISPIVFLGGLLIASLLNLSPQIELQLRRDRKRITATVAAEIKPINLSVAALCCLLLVILVGYVVLENAPRS